MKHWELKTRRTPAARVESTRWSRRRRRRRAKELWFMPRAAASLRLLSSSGEIEAEASVHRKWSPSFAGHLCILNEIRERSTKARNHRAFTFAPSYRVPMHCCYFPISFSSVNRSKCEFNFFFNCTQNYCFLFVSSLNYFLP